MLSVEPWELEHLQSAFERMSAGHNLMEKEQFINCVLAEVVPRLYLEPFYAAAGVSQKGVTFRELVSIVVLLTRGTLPERALFLHHVYGGADGVPIEAEDFERMLLRSERPMNADLSRSLAAFPLVDSARLQELVRLHPHACSLFSWAHLPPRASVKSFKAPTLYETLAGLSAFSEDEVRELERGLNRTKYRGGDYSGIFAPAALELAFEPLLPAPLARHLFRVMDTDSDGDLSLTEAVRALSKCLRGTRQEQYDFCFDVFNTNGSGAIDLDQLAGMLTTLDATADSGRRPRLVSTASDVLPPSELEKEVGATTTGEDAVTPDAVAGPPTYQPLEHDGSTAILARARTLLCSDTNVEGVSMSRDAFVAWATESKAMDLFLSLINQLAHLHLGLRPDSVRDEADMINAYLRRLPGALVSAPVTAAGVVDGAPAALSQLASSSEPAYLIDNRWWQAWQAAASPAQAQAHVRSKLHRAPSPANTGDTATKAGGIGPIENSPLVRSTGMFEKSVYSRWGPRLKRGLVSGKDFTVLPKAVWEALHQWYGGGPTLARPTMRGPANRLELELYPLSLKVMRHNTSSPGSSTKTGNPEAADAANLEPDAKPDKAAENKPQVSFFFHTDCSRDQTIGQLVAYTCKQQRKLPKGRARLRADNARLWDFRSHDRPVLLDETLTVRQAGLDESQQVLLEMRNADLSWPSELYLVAHGAEDNVDSAAVPKSKRTPGITGLSNLGNTCYMNSALQCISHTRPLSTYFMRRLHTAELNINNPLGMGGAVALKYGELLQSLWSGKASVAPVRMLRTIQKYGEQFRGYRQHDSQDFLGFVMDGLHEDLNRVSDKPYVEKKDSNGRPDTVVAREGWEGHLLRNRSVVVDHFHGQLRSQLRCLTCQHTSVSFDPFSMLSLPLPAQPTYMEVVLNRLDGRPGTRYGLQFSGEDESSLTYGAVKERLAPLCGLDVRSLAFLDITGNTIHRQLSDAKRVRSGTGHGLTAFEIALPRAISATKDSSPGEAAASTATKPAIRVPGSVVEGHLPLLQRRLVKHNLHFLVAPLRATTVSSPVLLPAVPGESTANELYEGAWSLLSRFLKSEARAKYGPASKKYPFTLKVVNSAGTACTTCKWIKACLGCTLETSDEPARLHPSCALAADWDAEVYHLEFDRSQMRAVEDHTSVAAFQRETDKPVSLDECLTAFTKEEELGKDEMWYCPKCKQHQLAAKKMDIWSLPPFLIVHLKRFQNMNGVWMKSNRRVEFPLAGFDPYANSVHGSQAREEESALAAAAPATVPPRTHVSPKATEIETVDQEPAAAAVVVDRNEECGPGETTERLATSSESSAPADEEHRGGRPLTRQTTDCSEFDPHSGHFTDPTGPRIYDLYACASHMGAIGGGHYVAFAQDEERQWHLFNDSATKATTVDAVAGESAQAYMLFYECRGVDYDHMLPDVTAHPESEMITAERSTSKRAADACVLM